jgi:hypothetical protein
MGWWAHSFPHVRFLRPFFFGWKSNWCFVFFCTTKQCDYGVVCFPAILQSDDGVECSSAPVCTA